MFRLGRRGRARRKRTRVPQSRRGLDGGGFHLKIVRSLVVRVSNFGDMTWDVEAELIRKYVHAGVVEVLLRRESLSYREIRIRLHPVPVGACDGVVVPLTSSRIVHTGVHSSD